MFTYMNKVLFCSVLVSSDIVLFCSGIACTQPFSHILYTLTTVTSNIDISSNLLVSKNIVRTHFLF